MGAGDAAAFSYDIGLFRGFQRAMETDEVCGRPLDSFAFASHVTMGKKRLGERMTDQHAGIVCSCHQLNRAKGSPEGRRPFGGVKGRSPLRLLVKKEKYFCKSSRNFRGSVEIYKHKDRERT